jgi:acyl-CoA dehydrogenase family protein 9
LLALSGVRGPSEDMKELGKISDVGTALHDPIKSLGVFTKFARKRMSNMMGSKGLTKAHPELKEQAEKFSSYVGKFAIAVENSLIKYGKKIVDNEMPQGRLADMVIELYVMMAVISRTTSILNGTKATQDQKEYVLKMTKIICKESGRKIRRNLKAMDKNNDKGLAKISESVVKYGGYGLEIIDF